MYLNDAIWDGSWGHGPGRPALETALHSLPNMDKSQIQNVRARILEFVEEIIGSFWLP